MKHDILNCVQLIEGIDVEVIVKAGAGDLRNLGLGGKVLERVREAYNFALGRAYFVAVASAGLAVLVGFGVEWRRLNK